MLAAYNVCAEEVKGEVNGKPYQGIVYSAMNDKGEKAGNPVKASRIGKSVGYEAVQRRMEKSGEAIRNGKLKERTRKIVATAMQTARSRIINYLSGNSVYNPKEKGLGVPFEMTLGVHSDAGFSPYLLVDQKFGDTPFMENQIFSVTHTSG